MTAPHASDVPKLPPGLDGPSSLGVAHIAAECHPFARTGGLAEAVANLSLYQVKAGLSTLVILPLHRSVRASVSHLEPALPPFLVQVGPRVEEARVWRLPDMPGNPRIFFIEHPYFDRPGIYGEGDDYADNHRRFGFFALAALAALPRIAPAPLVLHCHDWHASFVPLFLRTRFAGDPFYDRIPSVLTIHNVAFQGHFPASALPDLGLPWELYTHHGLEWNQRANFLKGGIAFADAITTVSPKHAWEIQTAEGGFGLHQALWARRHDLIGILNGLDQDTWDPRSDPHIAARFSPEDLAGKARCREELQRASGLSTWTGLPVVCSVGRLAHQKGIEVLLGAIEPIARHAQLVVLGSGERKYEDALRTLAWQAPDRFGIHTQFSDAMEHKVMAGADMFLMPSLYEPCGLTQMRAQRYGTVPIGRRVGGIADSIDDGVTGFLFDAYDPGALAQAFERALAHYYHPPTWQAMMQRAMARDFGWERPVAEYVDLYRKVLALPARAAGARR